MNIQHRRLFQRTVPVAVIGAIGLTIAACGGGSNPEERKPTSTPEISAPTSAGLAMEWTENDLETDTSRIGYGSNPKGILARKDGALVFTPQTPRDHIASRFIEVPPYNGSRELELDLDQKTAGGDDCLAALQDQNFNTLVSVPCKDAGDHKASAKISPGVKTVRLYFNSPKQAPMKLPARVKLAEHR